MTFILNNNNNNNNATFIGVRDRTHKIASYCKEYVSVYNQTICIQYA